ncbi:Hemolymph lipopolysaccharide-binding protein, partial [Blattella germanica]
PKCKCSKLTTAPSDYKQRVPGEYYKYHSETKTWFEAWATCENEGGHLAVLRSDEQAKYVGALGGEGFDWAFIGFQDMFQEGNFITLFDETLEEAGYNKWPNSDPNGGTSENCGVIFPNGLLGDYKCQNPRTFICQIDIC